MDLSSIHSPMKEAYLREIKSHSEDQWPHLRSARLSLPNDQGSLQWSLGREQSDTCMRERASGETLLG